MPAIDCVRMDRCYPRAWSHACLYEAQERNVAMLFAEPMDMWEDVAGLHLAYYVMSSAPECVFNLGHIDDLHPCIRPAAVTLLST